MKILLTLFLNKIDHRGSSMDSEQVIDGEQQAMQVLGSSLGPLMQGMR